MARASRAWTQIGKLFDDFSAAANTVAMRGGVNGSGLGLPICARLTRLMGGSLVVRDRTDGPRGVEFALVLPWRVPLSVSRSSLGGGRLDAVPGDTAAAVAGHRLVPHTVPNGVAIAVTVHLDSHVSDAAAPGARLLMLQHTHQGLARRRPWEGDHGALLLLTTHP
jgi:hypothetical protein